DIAAGIATVSELNELHRAGKLRIIATSGPSRSRQLPEVATFREQGLMEVEAVGWTALFAPAGTAREIVDRLSAAMVAVMHEPDVRERFVGMGVEPTGTTSDELASIVSRDTARWSPIIKASGFSPE